jgi:hypothetical protein
MPCENLSFVNEKVGEREREKKTSDYLNWPCGRRGESLIKIGTTHRKEKKNYSQRS